ncbi:MAG: endolytic transglycosylase MltG [Rhizobiales bacterium]|nr:endolytic transglycosylase MltG [Hyphomicrobiales bacterium]MBN9009729.1 endolytic transglycosylase MltG [Hyphomicrobiales bacterium]
MSDIRRDRYGSDSDILSARLSSSSRAAPKSPTEMLQPEVVPPPPQRSRAVRHPLVIFLNFVLTLVIVAVIAGGAGLFIGRMQFNKPGALDQARTVSIDRGTSLGAIADILTREGAITSKWLFMAGVWMEREQNNLKAGEYLIPAHASMRDIMEAMVGGKGILYSISVPEGLTSQQIVDRLNADPVLVGDISEVPPEGSLLPETYKFTRGDTRENILSRMRRDRDRTLTDIWNRRASDSPLKSAEELVVLASIVEKETGIADERSRVAAVFINRLRLNMRLQSDPTVVYAKFGGKGKPSDYTLSKDDLSTDSPYNTYTNGGLPPGPIANPGRASLEAVANPSRTRDLYFVADGSGGHAFAETYEDHLRNVARWRQVNGGNGGAAAADAPDAADDGDAAPAAPVPVAKPKPAASGDAPMALQPDQ